MRNYRYKILPLADSDIDECYLYLKRENQATASQFLDRVIETLERIAQAPYAYAAV